MTTSRSCVRCGGAMVSSPHGVRCGNCGAGPAATPSPQTTTAIHNPPGSRVAAGHRKLCAHCGADITFAKRERDGSGALLCLKCAAAGAATGSGDASVATRGNRLAGDPRANAPASLATSQPGPLDPLEQLAAARAQAAPTPPILSHATLPRRPKKSPLALIVGLSAAGLVVAIIAVFLATRPGWEEKNHDRLLAMKKDADELVIAKQPKEAYLKYQELLGAVGDHFIKDDALQSAMDDARRSMDRVAVPARAILAKEEAEAKARAQAEQARLASEAAERDRQERQRREAEAQAAASPSGQPSPKPIRPFTFLPAPAPPKVIGSINGSAWLNRVNGESLLQRGLKVQLLRPTVQANVIVNWMDKTKNDLKTNWERAKEEYDQDKKRYDYASDVTMKSALEGYEKFNTKAAQLGPALLQSLRQSPEMPLLDAYNIMQQLSEYGMAYFRQVTPTLVISTTSSDVDGKWELRDVPAGDYFIYAIIDTRAVYVEWLAPVTVKSADPVKMELHNDTAIYIHN